jgi:hypothetical protein
VTSLPPSAAPLPESPSNCSEHIGSEKNCPDARTGFGHMTVPASGGEQAQVPDLHWHCDTLCTNKPGAH